jgi:hypothetical protein
VARSVDTVPGFAEVVEDQIRALDADCATGALFLIDELGAADPDLDERCGLLDMRHEVYAVRIPGCRRHRLVVSIDRGGKNACAVHGVVPAAGRICDAAHGLAAVQLKLIGRAWEPADDRTFAQGPPPRGAPRRRRGA